ncbi:hypothetical protein FPL04_00385 [Xanthomonas arboricola]|nr:hypothetical protein FPL04_00385 [Xanthomonas arboricola]
MQRSSQLEDTPLIAAVQQVIAGIQPWRARVAGAIGIARRRTPALPSTPASRIVAAPIGRLLDLCDCVAACCRTACRPGTRRRRRLAAAAPARAHHGCLCRVCHRYACRSSAARAAAGG